MAVVGTDVERYSDPHAFAKEVNLPLLGTAALSPVAPGASLSDLLVASATPGLEPIVENLAQTRQSLTLRSLLLAGFPHDPECFALGLALGRAWSRRGLKVAVVDMDAWCPTIVRAPGEPSEGLVDVLEYGCSFQRVAWEMVAGSLWVVGPGMHPAEELRLADHSEWDRASRVFSARVDVTLYVAPFLHKPGLTGRLSKRMDGAILTASVERVGRVELRDAFLELWGSDAPIIGCVAIDPRAVAPEPPRPAARDTKRTVIRYGSAPRREPEAFVDVKPVLALSSVATKSYETVADNADAYDAPAYDAAVADAGESGLVAALEREIRADAAVHRMRARRRGRGWVPALAFGGVLVAGAAGWFAFVAPRDARPVGDVRTTGDEAVLPAPDAPSNGAPSNTPAPSNSPLPSNGPSPSTGPLAGAMPPSVASTPAAGAAVTTPIAARLGMGGTSLTAAPPAEGKKFRVHVASFRSEEKVAPIVRALRLKGLDAWYEKASDAPGWYRVFVGRFATEDEAKAYATWLLQNQWVDRAHAFPSTSR